MPLVCRLLMLAFAVVWLCFAKVAIAQLVLSTSDIHLPDTGIGGPSSSLMITVTNMSDSSQYFNPHLIPASCPYAYGGPTPACLASAAANEDVNSFTLVSIYHLLLPKQSGTFAIYFAPLVARTLGDTIVFLDTSVDPPRVIAQASVSGTGIPTPLSPGSVLAIEYYNSALDHYFFTPLQDEIQKLDSGFFAGWQRTGYSFWVSPAGTNPPGSTPVCRFYGLPQAGLDSHFYSASPGECQAVISRFSASWELETAELFDAILPDSVTGACPESRVPLHRVYDNRTDANHRYMVEKDFHWDQLVTEGWVPEGYGDATVHVSSACLVQASVGVASTWVVRSHREPASRILRSRNTAHPDTM